MARKAPATTKGNTSQVRRSGNDFSIAAKKMRPAVTVPQNIIRATEASVVVTTSAPTSNGRPHQMPNPTKIATNTGASAVPNPSKAFSTSTALSTLCGNNAAAKVLMAGTVSPNPIPMQVVAINKTP